MSKYRRWTLERLERELQESNTQLDLAYAVEPGFLLEEAGYSRADTIMKRYGRDRLRGEQTPEEKQHMLEALAAAGLSAKPRKGYLRDEIATIISVTALNIKRARLNDELAKRQQVCLFSTTSLEKILQETKIQRAAMVSLKERCRRLDLEQLRARVREIGLQIERHPLNAPEIVEARQFIMEQNHREAHEISMALKTQGLLSLAQLSALYKDLISGLIRLLQQQLLLERDYQAVSGNLEEESESSSGQGRKSRGHRDRACLWW